LERCERLARAVEAYDKALQRYGLFGRQDVHAAELDRLWDECIGLARQILETEA
jgi:hypothetical protein